jgi:hypothetical protein
MTVSRSVSRRLLAGVAACSLASIVVAGSVSNAGAQDLPAEFQGDWVPATADCESDVRLLVTATRMTLVNGADASSYGNVTIAPAYFGPDYRGISVASMPASGGDVPPFTVLFNAGEEKGVTRLEIYRESKARRATPQVEAVEAVAKKLSERFPLDAVPLKKCAEMTK